MHEPGPLDIDVTYKGQRSNWRIAFSRLKKMSMNGIFPCTVSSPTHCGLRNASNIDTVSKRTGLFASSRIPFSVSLWNSLTEEIKSLSLSIVKTAILHTFQVAEVPKYYTVGERKLS